MTTQNRIFYVVPERPYDTIAAYNRAALASGGPRSAESATHSDYNGHRVQVSRVISRQWVAGYMWAGWKVIARDRELTPVLEAAIAVYNRGALGASVEVVCETEEDIAECVRHGLIADGSDEHHEARAWFTWRHAVARRMGHLINQNGYRASNEAAWHNDKLLHASESEAAYYEALRSEIRALRA